MNDNRMTPDEQLQPVLELLATDGEAAVRQMEDLLPRYEEDPRLHFLLGSTLAGLQRYAEAELAMQRAIAIAPDFNVARFQLGLLQLSSGHADDAQATWQPLLALPGDDPLRLFAEGLGRMIADDFDAAIPLLERGMARNTGLAPMNADMALMVQEMRKRLEVPATQEVESGAHFLLRQYSFKDTKH